MLLSPKEFLYLKRKAVFLRKRETKSIKNNPPKIKE